jgi:hypothetical protein
VFSLPVESTFAWRRAPGPRALVTPEGHSVFSSAGLAYLCQALHCGQPTEQTWALNTLLAASAAPHDEILLELRIPNFHFSLYRPRLSPCLLLLLLCTGLPCFSSTLLL